MVQTWRKGEGKDFVCPHCGAKYRTVIHRFPARDSDCSTCSVCKKVMDRWNSTAVPSYTLISENRLRERHYIFGSSRSDGYLFPQIG